LCKPAIQAFLSAAFLGWLVLAASGVAAQDVTEVSLKAAFVHNFIRFTVWPGDVLAAGAPLTVCIVGDMAMAGVLESYVKGHPVDGHGITVSRVGPGGSLRLCNLVYVSGVTSRQASLVAQGLNGTPVLTVSDVDPFATAGGIAQLSVEDGRMRFRINLETAKRCRLQLSSKLLSLAILVKDDPNALAR
jgi:hypothetical protein